MHLRNNFLPNTNTLLSTNTKINNYDVPDQKKRVVLNFSITLNYITEKMLVDAYITQVAHTKYYFCRHWSSF